MLTQPPDRREDTLTILCDDLTPAIIKLKTLRPLDRSRRGVRNGSPSHPVQVCRVLSVPIVGMGVCGAQEVSCTLTEASGVDRTASRARQCTDR